MALSPEELQASILAMLDIATASTPQADGTPSLLAKEAMKRIAGFAAQPSARLSHEELDMPYERRLKLVRIHPDEVLCLFQDWKKCKYIQVRSVEGLPEGARIVSIHADPLANCFEACVHHDDFDIVADGAPLPYLFDGLAPVEHVRLKRAKEDHQGRPAFDVPTEET